MAGQSKGEPVGSDQQSPIGYRAAAESETGCRRAKTIRNVLLVAFGTTGPCNALATELCQATTCGRNSEMTTVLVVDDSPIDRRLAGGILEKDSVWEVLYASDAEDALEAVRRQPPDLIITDMQMPEMNGLELLTAVRREFPAMPIILMTAKGSEELAAEALRVGANSYVPKRSLATDLVETSRRVLAATREGQSLTQLMRRLTTRHEVFTLETDLDLLMSMCRYLQQTLTESWGLDKIERLRLGTALEEALLNAYYHGNLEVSSALKLTNHHDFYATANARLTQEPYGNRRITVKFSLDDRQALITVEDQGPGFNPQMLPDPTNPENLDLPSGRGVMLMRAFMDDVSYNDAGNAVTLIKRRPLRRPNLQTGPASAAATD
jgi:CheY-like chemotaxis protein